MPSTYTSNNKIQKIATGEQSGTWGSTTNTNFDLFDTAIDGFVAVAVTGTTTTLNIPDGSAADGRNKVLSFTGALSAANTVSVTPNTVKKHYFVQNNTTGSQNIIIYQGSGSTVTVKPGYSSVVYLDGAGGSASAKEVLTSLKLTALLEATGAVFVGSTSGSTTLQSTAVASGTLTLPAATDTLVGKATTDTFTNKTLDTAGTGNVLRINGTQVSAVTGTGSVVLATSPTLVTPAIGTPTSGTLTSCTGLPISTGVSGLGSGVATFLATPSSSNLAAAVTDETGTGALVFATSPTIATPTVTTSAVIPIVNGGTAVSSTLTLQSTSGAGTSDAIVFKTASQSEKMRITTAGNVGIGNVSPGAALHVFGNNGSFGASAFFGLSGSSAGISIANTGSVGYLQGATTAASGVTANIGLQVGGGSVGIGTATPAYKLEISTDSAGKPGVGGLWTVVSDERIKTDITPADLDRCYEIVKSVPLKHFGFAPGVYTDDQINDKHSLGWIAQDVQKVFSKAVSVKPFTLNTEIPDGTEEYTEQEFTLETVEKTETSIEIIDGKPVKVSKVVTSENKVLLFDSVDVVDEAGAVVMDGDKPLTYQMPRMITKTRNKVRHDVIEDCLDLNGGQMIAALYGAVQALMLQVESLTASK